MLALPLFTHNLLSPGSEEFLWRKLLAQEERKGADMFWAELQGCLLALSKKGRRMPGIIFWAKEEGQMASALQILDSPRTDVARGGRELHWLSGAQQEAAAPGSDDSSSQDFSGRRGDGRPCWRCPLLCGLEEFILSCQASIVDVHCLEKLELAQY